jgi:hypothetical protein
VKLLEGIQTAQVTAFRFTRPLKGCSLEQTTLSTTNPIWLIYAFGKSNSLSQHDPTSRGQALVDLSGTYFQGLVPPSKNNPENSEIFLGTDEINVPKNESTIYAYKFYDLGEEKKHIIAENYKIGSSMTHHVLVYLCDKIPPAFQQNKNALLVNYYRDPPKQDEIQFLSPCFSAYIGWAKGGKDRIYPDTLGKPIGTLTTRYMIVEVHLNNVDSNLANTTDPGSGVTLIVTKNLRKHDVGMMTLGADMSTISLPPGGLNSVAGECSESCTSRFPTDGLNIIGAIPHQHKRGAALEVKHIRNNIELESLPQKHYYDFNFQSFDYASTNQQKFLPKDRILVNCTYNTKKDTTTIIGGHSTEQEMCF